MKFLLYILVAFLILIVAGPTIITFLILFFTYSGALISSIFETDTSNTYVILVILIFLFLISLLFRAKK